MCSLFSESILRRLWCLVVMSFFWDCGSCLWKPEGLRVIGSGELDKGRGWFVYSTTNGCPLNPLGTYPYALKIWTLNSDAHLYLKTAAILSHKAVLTHCTGFRNYGLTELRVMAQRIFRAKYTYFRSCMQERRIVNTFPHPKCNQGTGEHEDDKFFDFQVLEIDKAFDAEKDFPYPTLPIHKQPYDLMQFIRKVMILRPGYDSCELPMFAVPNAMFPVFEVSSLVTPEAYDDMKCIWDLCNLLVGMKNCKERLQSYGNYTFMCVSTSFKRKYDSSTSIQPHEGAPIVCNNTAIGQVTMNVYRSGKSEDYLLVATYLRVWPWLMKMKQRYWNFYYNREKWDSPFLEFRPWREWSFSTPAWDKDLSVAEYNFFKFITENPAIKPRSGGNRLQVTFAYHIYAALIPIIFTI